MFCFFLRVSELVRVVTKTELPAHQQMLEIIPSFAEDEDCEKVPPIRYLFRWGGQLIFENVALSDL